MSDPTPSKDKLSNIETLQTLGRSYPLPGRRFALPGDVGQEPAGRQRTPRHIRLELVPDFVAMKVEAAVTYHEPGDSDELVLDADGLTITSVHLDGAQWRHEHDGTILRVPLPGRPSTVRIHYIVHSSAGLHWSTLQGVDTPYLYTQGQPEGARTWFPCRDDLAERVTTDVIVTVPRGMHAVAAGQLVSSAADGDSVRFHWRENWPHPPYLVSLAAGAFAVQNVDSRGRVRTPLYAPHGLADAAQVAFARTTLIMAFLERRTGVSYPFKKYAQVVVPDHVGGAMENLTASHFSHRVVPDATARADRVDIDYAVVHEMAHHWFGNSWTVADWSEIWLQESFCKFLEIVYYEDTRGSEEAEYYFDAQAHTYYDEAARYRRPLREEQWSSPQDIFDRHSYVKGALLLHHVRGVLGEEDFWAGVRRFTEQSVGRQVNTGDFVRAFRVATGKDIQGFLDELGRAGHPDIVVRWEWNEVEGAITLRLEQRQSEQPFRLRAEVAVHNEGRVETHAIDMYGREQLVSIPCGTPPDLVVFDPRRLLIAEVECRRNIDELRFQLTHDPSVRNRIQAASALADHGGEDAERLLVTTLRSYDFWAVRAACASALAELKTDEGLAVLREHIAAADTPPRLRAAAVRALSSWSPLDEVRQELLELAEDSSGVVCTAAIEALAEFPGPEVRKALAAALRRDSYGETVRTAALNALAVHECDGSIGDAALLREWALEGSPPAAREAAVAALSGQRPVSEENRSLLATLTTDPSAYIQLRAVEGLVRAGGRQALGHLLRCEREVPMLSGVRRVCREGIEILTAAIGD
ncbi:M1 family aminopeptidase [Lentzea sp. NPDC051208]|uniref:M1 family aminopeptidase n=1 Tax=Lentzea sp. NPDC051208 TaxID=3154642 RepID=UPI00341DA0C6